MKPDLKKIMSETKTIRPCYKGQIECQINDCCNEHETCYSNVVNCQELHCFRCLYHGDTESLVKLNGKYIHPSCKPCDKTTCQDNHCQTCGYHASIDDGPLVGNLSLSGIKYYHLFSSCIPCQICGEYDDGGSHPKGRIGTDGCHDQCSTKYTEETGMPYLV